MAELANARVLIVGAGGLGAPAILGLLDAGCRHLTVLEPDRVERTNLHRQIAYREADVGRPKLEALRDAAGRVWPTARVDGEARAFRAGEGLPGRFDLVLDGTDDLGTKLALADACVDAGVPFVFAGVVGLDGQALAVRPGLSACPRCLFERAPPPGVAPTCDEVGVLGPIAGIVAAQQVALGLALLAGDSPTDRLWTYDGRHDRVRTVALSRDPACIGCGARRERAAPGREAAAVRPEDAVLDLSGLACPATFIATRRRLDTMPAGARLRVLLTSDESSRVVPASLEAAGHRVLSVERGDDRHEVLVERAPDLDGAGPTA